MDGKIDTVREAIDEIQNIKWLIDEGPAHVKLTEAQDRLTKLKAALSAIDPGVIRRECAEKAEAWFYSTVGGASTIAIERHLIDLRLRQISTLRAAILSTEPKATAEEALHKSSERAYAWRHEMMGDDEPAQDDRLKPTGYDDENPCASCKADDPAECEECGVTDVEHVDSMWKPEPAQDDGKADRELSNLQDGLDEWRTMAQDAIHERETLKAQRDELQAVLADIGSYTGEGRLNSAWQSIVKSLGEKARAAIANAEKDKP